MSFFENSVVFLGHILLADGISTNLEKVEKVKNWPTTKNVKKVHSILGVALYYKHFIHHFTNKAQCLHDLISPVATILQCHSKDKMYKQMLKNQNKIH